MNEIAENALLSWSAPQCPFPIEYSPRMLDDIRLAVVDAFFSLPRGGAEIGGVLLGRWEQGRLAMCVAFGFDYKDVVAPILPTGIYTIPEASMAGETEEFRA